MVQIIDENQTETFECTPQLRWVNEPFVVNDRLISNDMVLQQAWAGSRGSIKWVDVPTEEA